MHPVSDLTQSSALAPPADPESILKAEHRTIETVLDAMQRMIEARAADGDFIAKAIDFLRNFADGCHHAKEEDAYFPALEKAGVPREHGPIGVMLDEHDRGRALIAAIDSAREAASAGEPRAAGRLFAAAADYVALLREHIDKEDNILFVMGERALGASARAALTRQFTDPEHSGCEAARHARYEKLAEELARWNFDAQ